MGPAKAVPMIEAMDSVAAILVSPVPECKCHLSEWGSEVRSIRTWRTICSQVADVRPLRCLTRGGGRRAAIQYYARGAFVIAVSVFSEGSYLAKSILARLSSRTNRSLCLAQMPHPMQRPCTLCV